MIRTVESETIPFDPSSWDRMSSKTSGDINVWRDALTPIPFADGPPITVVGGWREFAMAAASYRAASLAKPDEPEPYYRLGKLLHSFYFECDGVQPSNVSILCAAETNPVDRKHAEEVIAGMNA